MGRHGTITQYIQNDWKHADKTAFCVEMMWKRRQDVRSVKRIIKKRGKKILHFHSISVLKGKYVIKICLYLWTVLWRFGSRDWTENSLHSWSPYQVILKVRGLLQTPIDLPLYPFGQGLSGPHSWCGRSGENKIPVPEGIPIPICRCVDSHTLTSYSKTRDPYSTHWNRSKWIGT